MIFQAKGSNTFNYNAAADDLDKELGINAGDLEEGRKGDGGSRALASQRYGRTCMKVRKRGQHGKVV